MRTIDAPEPTEAEFEELLALALAGITQSCTGLNEAVDRALLLIAEHAPAVSPSEVETARALFRSA